MMKSLTYDLKASVRVELANVSGAEPALTVTIDKKILFVLGLVLIVTHCYVGSTNDNFTSWVWFVCPKITSWRSRKHSEVKSKYKKKSYSI